MSGHERAAADLIAVELARAHRPCATISFQAEDMVLADLLRRVRPDLPMLFLDTLHHFPETLAYRDEMARRWGLDVITLRAAEPAPGLWQSSLDACCGRHKMAPLFEALAPYDAWFTGLRRDQSPSRAALQTVDAFHVPGGVTLRKISPLAAWSMADVRAYVDHHGIPLLPLYAQGYLSIGCEPCTSVPVEPSSPRSGRWLGRKQECGIHLGDAGPARSGPGPSSS